MSYTPLPGCSIALETCNPDGADASRFALHLLSNIAAAMALGDIPSRDVFFARAADPNPAPKCWDDYAVGDEIVPDLETDFSDGTSIRATLKEIERALAAGKIVVTDQAMTGMDEALRSMGDALNLERFLGNPDFQPNLVLYLDSAPDQVPESSRAIDAQFHRLAERFPNRVVVVEHSNTHQVMCDMVWSIVYGRLRSGT